MVGLQAQDRIAMSQRERDRLEVLRGVLSGDRTQVDAARLLKLCVRQVRRLVDGLEAEGDGVLVHGLRGRPSNRQREDKFRRQVLSAYRKRYADFGPEANAVLAKELPAHNHKFVKRAREQQDGYRRLGPEHRLASILSLQTERVVSNDYVVRLADISNGA